MSDAFEVNFDGIIGPTHNYAGLSYGNVASVKNAQSISNPKAAALQGLAKMKFLHDLGVKLAVLPPHPRPNLAALRRLGFDGSDTEVIAKAHRADPRLLAATYSASAMWAANAATVSPSADTQDGRVHFTAANLISQFHRSLEAPFTSLILRAIFPEGKEFAHHDPLPSAAAFADEGAANHMRLCAGHGENGIEVFIHGRTALAIEPTAARFPARQTLEANQATARRHLLHANRTLFLQQNPQAIDAGAFHNDVVAVGNQNVLLIHESALANQKSAIDELKHAVDGLKIVASEPGELTLTDAVESYVFNSQLVTLPDGSMSLIAPVESRENAGAQRFIQRALASKAISTVHYLDVRQSMNNGGGPACLRLRVVLTNQQWSKVHPGVIFTEALHAKLTTWIQKHYRESLNPADLADPSLMRESRAAIGELFELLKMNESLIS